MVTADILPTLYSHAGNAELSVLEMVPTVRPDTFVDHMMRHRYVKSVSFACDRSLA